MASNRNVKSFVELNWSVRRGKYVGSNSLIVDQGFLRFEFCIRLTLRLDNNPVANFHLINAVAITA